MTFKERLEAGLLAMGWTIALGDKSRYTAFVKKGQPFKLFVGINGALRKGECASRSYSIGDATRQNNVYKAILLRGTPKDQVGLHRLAAEFGQDTDHPHPATSKDQVYDEMGDKTKSFE